VTKVLNINVITNISEMLHVKLLCLASLFVASQMLNKATSFVVHLTVNTFQFLGDVIWWYKKISFENLF